MDNSLGKLNITQRIQLIFTLFPPKVTVPMLGACSDYTIY